MQKSTCLQLSGILFSALFFFGCGKPSDSNGAKALAKGNVPAAISQDPSSIVARVDDTPLTWGDMEKRANGFLQDETKVNHLMIPSNRMEEAKTFFRRRAINTFVFKTVMMNEATRQKIQITENDKNESYLSLVTTLRQRNWTTNDFFNHGPLDPASMHKEFEDGIVVDKLLRLEVRNKLKITNDEITREVTNLEKTNDLQRVKLEDVRKQLLNGADFEEVARNVSQCPSAKSGGDIGEFIRSGRLPKSVEDQAFRQKVGEIGPVIRSTMGFHILKVTSKMPAREKTASTPAVPESIHLSQILLKTIPVNKKKIMDTIIKIKFDHEAKDYFKQLLKKSSVECFLYPDMKFGEDGK